MSDLFEENTTSTANGFYNLKIEKKDGTIVSLGGILDHAKLGKKEKALLDLIVGNGVTPVKLVVTYNGFTNTEETTLDEL